jgi:hypothetical protein
MRYRPDFSPEGRCAVGSRAIDSSVGAGSGGDIQPVTNPYLGAQYDVGPSLYDRRNIAFVNFVY